MTTLLFINWLTVALLWVSLVCNIILLFYIFFDGNRATRLRGIIHKLTVKVRVLEDDNDFKNSQWIIENRECLQLKKTNQRLLKHCQDYEKLIKDNGWELGFSTHSE